MIIERDKLADVFSLRKHLKRFNLVFTNGCFDILHVGHITYLQEAATLGTLVVAVNTDESVAKLKPGRPILKLRDRMLMLDSLKSVAFVTSFHEDTPLEIIKEIAPDILVKGSDYEVENIVGAKEVLGWGGQVKTIPLVEGVSTSSIIRRMKALT